MTGSELAWLAGIIEGEGSVFLKRNIRGPHQPSGRHLKRDSINYVVTLTVGMTDEDVVRRAHKVGGCGRVYGPKFHEGRKTSWHWNVYGTAARELLGWLRPYMGERRGAKIDEVLAA